MTKTKEILKTFTEELEMAIHWDRPSLLLLTYDDSMQFRLFIYQLLVSINILGLEPVFVPVTPETYDIPLLLRAEPDREKKAFIITGLDNGGGMEIGHAYKALNIRRELLIEDKVKTIFCLNRTESKKIPTDALDFWVFRHRSFELPSLKTKIQKERIITNAIGNLYLESISANPCYSLIEIDKIISEMRISESPLNNFLIRTAAYLHSGGTSEKGDDLIAFGNELIERNPESTDHILLTQNLIHQCQNNFLAIIENYHKLIHPELLSAAMCNSVALAFLEVGEKQKAITLLENALANMRKSKENFESLITLYMQAGEMDKAKNIAEISIKAGYKTTHVHHSLFLIEKERGNIRAAKNHLRNLLFLTPEDLEMWKIYASI
jgi:tetratricopeptide (TPR) repeat protein